MSNRRIGKIAPVILAGGFGTRLFPHSTRAMPKQFIRRGNASSLFQQTLTRATMIGAPFIIGNIDHQDILRTQSAPYNCAITFEPMARNTAAAIIIAALSLCDQGYETAIICPSDHIIHENAAFSDALIQAVRHMKHHKNHVVFGILPTAPSSDYGYIQTDEFGNVTLFKEKPDAQIAQNLLNDTPHTFWNSGICCVNLSLLLDDLAMIAPEFLALCRDAYKTPDAMHYAVIPALPFDRLYLEHAPHLFCIEAPFDWRDVGAPEKKESTA